MGGERRREGVCYPYWWGYLGLIGIVFEVEWL